jgi:asparagine synthase (glutamine-hydrolysing)
MSTQCGKWNFDGRPVDPEYFNRVANLLSPYGPEGQNFYLASNVCLGYLAFHATKESRREIQPHLSHSGDLITWDGILDNRKEVVEELEASVAEQLTDLSIVAAAWARWGTNCFAKLIGDWALTIWRPLEQTLFLAKDFIGTRHLYYYLRPDCVTWSTVLDPLIVLAGCSFKLDEDYVAGWISHFPATHLTPFVGVSAVPPASYIQIRNGRVQTTRYWDFRPGHTISYQKDRDYEDHFRTVLDASVRRRLRSDAPILAELSGGMDSSAIVCTADRLVARGCAPATRIDTVSYYQDGEPAWDERPYIAAVEQMRARVGCHIDVSTHTVLNYRFDTDCPELTPVCRGTGSESVKHLAGCIASNGNRVLLSGFAGDEILGGAPSFIPQLADLFVEAKLVALTRQLSAWALSNKTTVVALLAEIVRAFMPIRWRGAGSGAHLAGWLHASFLAAHRTALSRYPRPFSLFRSKPSFQEKLQTIEALRCQLASFSATDLVLCEKRYPYLDRDLVEFVFAIPAIQLQRPGQRRSLMRRALSGIVPDEVLNRKRKAFVARQALVDIRSHWSAYRELTENSILVDLHVIDGIGLLDSLAQAKAGNIIPLPPLAHALVLEKWLRHIRPFGFVASLPGYIRSNGKCNPAAGEPSISAESLANERR